MLDNIHKGIIEMSASDLQQFKNVIGEVMMPVILDIATHCRVTGKINNIEDDFIQNLSMKIFLKLPDFNNSKTKEYGETYRFSTFVNLYVDDAIRLTRAKEKGYKCMILDRYEGMTTPENWWIDLQFRDTLKYLSSAIYCSVNDPKGIQGNLNGFSYSEKLSISEALKNAYDKAVEASSLENDNQKAAIKKWGEVLGTCFPDYTGA